MAKETSDKPQPPKRPLSAFFLFRQERYTDVVKANPGKKVSEITQVISEEWRKLSDEKKAGYSKHYTTAKVKYDKDIKAYTDVHGKVERKKKIKRGGKEKAAKGTKKAKGVEKDNKAKSQ